MLGLDTKITLEKDHGFGYNRYASYMSSVM